MFNAHILRNKFLDLVLAVSEEIQIISISESWKNTKKIYFLAQNSLPNYSLFTIGVLIYLQTEKTDNVDVVIF